MDGQQRILSICQYHNGDFSIKMSKDDPVKYFHNLTKDEQEQILNYDLMIYFCNGTEREKLDWFKVINITGEKLTNQELLNASYTGPWLMDAKQFFSKTNGPAADSGKDLIKGTPIRQDYLETVLKWIINDNDEYKEIEDYMAAHKEDKNADELKKYFKDVIKWVNKLFPKKRKEQKNVEWGILYNKYRYNNYDAKQFEEQVSNLMINDEVTNKSGIYRYIFTKDEHDLNIRVFNQQIKRKVYENQGGKCKITGEEMSTDDMEADHIIPWSQGGKTTIDNCQMVSKLANRRKSDS